MFIIRRINKAVYWRRSSGSGAAIIFIAVSNNIRDAYQRRRSTRIGAHIARTALARRYGIVGHICRLNIFDIIYRISRAST